MIAVNRIVNPRRLFFALLFFCLVNVLSAQDKPTHRFSWTEDVYAKRYEVIIEKEENGRYRNVLREFTEELFIYFSLVPGNYRLRVIPYDFRNLPGEATSWRNFEVLALEEESELAEESPSVKHKDLFIALFAEGSGYTRYDVSFGGGIAFGGSYNGKGAGISLLYAQDEEKLITMEALAHFRLYFSRAKTNTGLFIQAEGGVAMFAKDKIEVTDFFVPVAGLRAGWRFPLGTRFFIEPSIRGGYPYIFGASLSGGLRF